VLTFENSQQSETTLVRRYDAHHPARDVDFSSGHRNDRGTALRTIRGHVGQGAWLAARDSGK
jgi:hypothetical protein